MTRERFIVGNWKQNHLSGPARATAEAIRSGLDGGLPNGVRVGIAPSYVALAACHQSTREHLMLVSQDVGAQDYGAFTGEVGPAMLADVGVHAAIVGHSERRALFGEHDELAARKTVAALAGGLTVILCIGEPLEIREASTHERYVLDQLAASLAGVDVVTAGSRLVLAYEPVWAIGTGRTATPTQANDMHGAIRTFLAERFGTAGRDRSILYGGSVKPDNAAELIAESEVDGFLVGGASLVANDFLAIVRAAAN